jgi:hypothetical protein
MTKRKASEQKSPAKIKQSRPWKLRSDGPVDYNPAATAVAHMFFFIPELVLMCLLGHCDLLTIINLTKTGARISTSFI